MDSADKSQTPNPAIMDGSAWRAFCSRLAEAGDIILSPAAPATPLDRAEGFRYLTRLLRIALEMNLEAADPDFPYFYKASHETAKIGADNPDNIYLNATVNAVNSYRITGTRGTMTYFGIGTKANRYHIDGTMASTGELDDSSIKLGPNGEIDIVVSATKHEGNWLQMAGDTSFVIIRQSYLDRGSEIPGSFKIERIGAPKAPRLLTPEFMQGALARSANFVFGTAATFHAWAQEFKAHPNRMPLLDQAKYCKAGGDPNITYLHGYFDFPMDHAWVIEVTPPECPYWNFQIENWWMESLDFRYLPVWVNKHTAHYNADGSVTIIVAASDPGFGNFVDRAGHLTGASLLRWLGAKEFPVPKCSVVPIAELSKYKSGSKS